MSKKNRTLNEMLAATKIPPGQDGSIWKMQKVCGRCQTLVWYHEDGWDGSIMTPQAHACIINVDKRDERW